MDQEKTNPCFRKNLHFAFFSQSSFDVRNMSTNITENSVPSQNCKAVNLDFGSVSTNQIVSHPVRRVPIWTLSQMDHLTPVKSYQRLTAHTTFSRQMIYLLLAVLLVQVISPPLVSALGIEVDDCPDNGMRKPPRFGKRNLGNNMDFNHYENDPSNEIDESAANSQSGDDQTHYRFRRSTSPCFRGPSRRRITVNPLFKRYLVLAANKAQHGRTNPAIARAVDMERPNPVWFGNIRQLFIPLRSFMEQQTRDRPVAYSKED